MVYEIFVYALVIGLTIVVQAIINAGMKPLSKFISQWNFEFITTVIALVLIYLVLIGFIIDVTIWAIVLYYFGVFPTFGEAFAQSLDSFTTLGGLEGLPSPWEALGPVMALNGIVIIAFAGSYLFAMVYADL